ncbi:MAG: M28 family peptidase [Thermoleophilaceae bacterium]|nr:M28 family peptidase [Thermoleophilaceae bacterium]
MAAAERTGIDVMAEVEALVAEGARGPGTDAERRAGRRLGDRLESLGRTIRSESLSTWPRWPAGLALLLLLGAGAGVLSVSVPEAGVALALVTLVVFVLDAGGAFPLARRPFGRRTSQNVYSPAPAPHPGALVIVAHVDAGRTGFVHRPGIARLLPRPLQLLAVLLASMLAACIVRVAGVDADALTAVQFGLAVLLLAAVALAADIWLSPTVPGASDNASGAALAVRLAERLDGKLESFGVHVLLTGAQETGGADGMRSFLRRHRRELPRDRTVFLNVDEVAAGSLRYARREGPLLAARSNAQLAGLCREAGAQPVDVRSASDGFAARYAGYPAITVTCRDEHGRSPWHHRRSDLPEHVEPEALAAAEELCVELAEGLDATVGPELREP